MALDDAVRRLLEFQPDAGLEALPYAERRASIIRSADEMYGRTGTPGDEVFAVADREVPVGNQKIRIRIYQPDDRSGRPVHLFLHGGGFWLSSIDELINDAICRARCAGADCVVVAVDYRLAPEHPFPTPFEDCYAALQWVSEHADELGVDADNISVGGVSAGANLAAAVAVASRDRRGPRLRLQLLEVPVLDLTLDTMRSSGVSDDYGITVADMERCTRLYLTEPEETSNRYASPLLATDLGGLPPTRIMTAEFDPLRLDGERFAEKLAARGVPVNLTRYPGAVHGSLGLTGAWAPARTWRDDTIAALRAAHHTDEPADHDGFSTHLADVSAVPHLSTDRAR